jgi:stage II sporulation protein P
MKHQHQRRRKTMQQPTFRSITLHINSKRSRRMVTGTICFLAFAFLIIGVIATRSVLMKNRPETIHSLDGRIPLYAAKGPIEMDVPKHENAVSSLLYFLTDFNLSDLGSLLNWQIPSMAVSNVQLLTTNPADARLSANPPQDSIPSPKISQTIHDSGNASAQTNQSKSTQQQTSAGSNSKPEVYIYHTHNREAYLPELSGVKNADDAYDATQNITKYGDKLVQELKTFGIPSIHTTVDYWTMGPYWNAYQYSRKTVQDVLKQNPGLKMILDIHRDSEPKSVTTTTVDGKSTAGIYIIIGGMNPRHDQNEKLANALKAQMDAEYPGLCRGIWRKTSTQYDTIYNQDLSPNSVLLEIGGPDNTTEELNLAVDDLAHVIANVLKSDK